MCLVKDMIMLKLCGADCVKVALLLPLEFGVADGSNMCMSCFVSVSLCVCVSIAPRLIDVIFG